MERLHAAVLLAWALVRSLFAPLFGGRRGLAEFRASYAADRLPPVAPDERRALSRMGGCIACGLCDHGGVIQRVPFAGTMDLMLASSRSMPDYDAARRSFEGVSDARLKELESRCPTRVPMRRVAAFVRAKAAEVDAMRDGSRPES